MTCEDGNRLTIHDAVTPHIMDLLWTIKDDLDLFLEDSDEIQPRTEEPFLESISIPLEVRIHPEFQPVTSNYSH